MITPDSIRNTTFEKQSMGGYRRSDVDAFLQDIASELEAAIREKNDAEQKLIVLAQKIDEYRKDEDNVKTALLNAQRMAESVMRDAKQKSELMLRDAGIKADDIIQDAHSQVLEEKRELERVQLEVSRFKNKILAMYRQHIESLSMLPEVDEKPVEEETIIEEEQIVDTSVQADEAEPVEIAIEVAQPAEEPKAADPYDAFKGIKFSD